MRKFLFAGKRKKDWEIENKPCAFAIRSVATWSPFPHGPLPLTICHIAIYPESCEKRTRPSLLINPLLEASSHLYVRPSVRPSVHPFLPSVRLSEFKCKEMDYFLSKNH